MSRPRNLLRAAAWGTLDAVLAFTLAPLCAACDAPLSAPSLGPVCPTCWQSIHPPMPPLCRRCGVSRLSWRPFSPDSDRCIRCRRTPSQIDAARSAGRYEGALRRIVQAFKYDGRRSLGRGIGRLMRDVSGDLLTDAACVVPVPLHPWRRVHRGFNQAADLARALDVPVMHLLWRARATPPQAGLAAAARRRNVRGAFRLSPLCRAGRRARFVEGQVVVLVDDVRTTGATLEACAGVLKAAGAREVRALTAACAELRTYVPDSSSFMIWS